MALKIRTKEIKIQPIGTISNIDSGFRRVIPDVRMTKAIVIKNEPFFEEFREKVNVKINPDKTNPIARTVKKESTPTRGNIPTIKIAIANPMKYPESNEDPRERANVINKPERTKKYIKKGRPKFN